MFEHVPENHVLVSAPRLKILEQRIDDFDVDMP
jgi:hypothetical protein